MINVEVLEKHSQANPLHPQVLIKLKEQALGQFMTYIPEPKGDTEDYYDDCAAFYDWMMENTPENIGDPLNTMAKREPNFLFLGS